MKKTLYASLLAMLFFSACQESEETEQLQQKEYTVSITARIGKTVAKARYQQTDATAAAEFIATDKIGVFMDDANVGCWIFDGISWGTDNSVYWKDKDEAHIFCAYYPYTEAEDKKHIKMPTLDSQDGSWGNIAKYDFLVASKTLSYNEGNGNVSFSSNNSFKHVSSLLKINIKSAGDMAKAVIDRITLESENLITQTYYSFETNDVTIDEITSKGTFSITPEHLMNNQDASFCFILNGRQTDENAETKAVIPHVVNMVIEYTNNSKKYTARRDGLSSDLLSGRIHEYNILIKDGTVTITGGSISGWTPGNEIEDIIINGEEATSINE